MSENCSPSWAAEPRLPVDLDVEDDEDTLLAFFSDLRSNVMSMASTPTFKKFGEVMRAYNRFRLFAGRDAMNTAWTEAKAGHPLLWPLKVYGEVYRARYRGSPAQKRHQQKYQSKPEVKARRAELARARRARKAGAC